MSEQVELNKKLDEWILKEGIPLEYYTASIFAQNNFGVRQSIFVEEDSSPREIDVLADKDYRQDETLLRISTVVECKWSKDKPWVVFTSPLTQMASSASIAQTIGSEVGRSVLWHAAGEEPLYDLSFFRKKEKNGFSGKQAFSTGVDPFYTALQSIISKTYLSVSRYDKESHYSMDFISIGFPIIVVDGKLYESEYKVDKIELKEVESSRIHWTGSSMWKSHATVTVVTKRYLPTFVSTLRGEYDQLSEFCFRAIENIKFLIEARDINVLNYKNASRGIIGLPKFLHHIVNSFGPDLL